ncbi:MAG: tol-pal system YbgF family protein, partial [Acidobacteriota bacterium]
GLTRHENAESLLEKARGGRRDLLHYLASQALAHVKAEKGDFEGAAELYRGLIGDPKNPFPKDCLLFGLAQAQEQAGHLEEAQRSYHRFLNEYSDSQLRGQVQQRSDLLELRLGT